MLPRPVVHSYTPDNIEVPANHRALHDDTVVRLMVSIKRLGLRMPITVAEGNEQLVLVAGGHRLEAVKRLGMDTIMAFQVPIDTNPDELRLWEIAENLDRAELSVQERADHIAEWVRLTEKKSGASCATKPGAGRSSEGGLRAAARELGIDRTEAQRAVKIASIPDDIRRAADEAGLNSQKARLEIAKADDGAAKVRELSEQRVKPSPVALNEFETMEQWVATGMRWWNRGSAEWREEFIRRTDSPVFDSTAAGRF